MPSSSVGIAVVRSLVALNSCILRSYMLLLLGCVTGILSSLSVCKPCFRLPYGSSRQTPILLFLILIVTGLKLLCFPALTEACPYRSNLDQGLNLVDRGSAVLFSLVVLARKIVVV